MGVKEQIEQIVKEIKVYRSHALYSLAMQKCKELMEIVQNSDRLARKDALLEAISQKIEAIAEEERDFEGNGKSTRMSDRELDVVKQLVGVPEGTGSNEAIWDVARACVILGQYEQALREFYRSIDNRYREVSAAKNVLRCHIEMSAIDEAINQYKLWTVSGLFSLEQMEDIRTFFQALLYKNNVDRLITDSSIENINHRQARPEETFIDVIAVKLTLVNEETNSSVEATLDVNYQKGSTFSVVVPGENEALLAYLEDGREIEGLELYSSSIIFTDRCRVNEKSRIDSGSKRGDYSVSLTILESDDT